ncbi:hypothetical protein OA238_118p0180 (plasmid) [Octadecabacter arcticus 238]|uniref:LicD family protein n=1 Tax=Octadecabacter arcticus 238 TaxID=391616 RepID=M9RRA5_9RHOB|nr:hypothetical protein [Octadecabacter arcticus]AGI74712.1 hypothetical protein OA238_118p0180 [Octadecabacter arcticus 238]
MIAEKINYHQLHITEEDVDRLRALSDQSMNFSNMADDDYFSKPENVYKLAFILGIRSDAAQLLKIWQNLSETSIVRDAIEFEIRLLIGPRINIEEIPVYAAKVSKFTNLLSDKIDLTNALHIDEGTEFLIALRLIISAGSKGESKLVKHILNALSPECVIITVEFVTNLVTFCAQNLHRMRPTASRKPWIELCNTLDKLAYRKCPDAVNALRLANAAIMTRDGKHLNALKLVKSAGGDNKRFASSLNMAEQLSKGNFKLANVFADQIILKTRLEQNKGEFNRVTAEQSLCALNTILQDAGVSNFIISGTLLGCIRDGRIFEHDKDFDIGVIGWESQFDVAAALLKSGRFTFDPRNLRGHRLFLLPVFDLKTGYDCDIFFFHDKGDHYLHGIDVDQGFTINFKFSKFELIEHKFLGDTFLIPDQYDKMLSENYGDDWRTPDPKYFVLLESPALLEKLGPKYSFCIRSQMLMLLERGASSEKAKELLRRVKMIAQPEDLPSEKIQNHFIQQFLNMNY